MKKRQTFGEVRKKALKPDRSLSLAANRPFFPGYFQMGE
jgi:hypothetical protein